MKADAKRFVKKISYRAESVFRSGQVRFGGINGLYTGAR
jgi:hypothetical protein